MSRAEKVRADRRTRSIAGRINRSAWRNKFCGYLFLNLVIIIAGLLLFFAFVCCWPQRNGQVRTVDSIRTDRWEAEVVLELTDGTTEQHIFSWKKIPEESGGQDGRSGERTDKPELTGESVSWTVITTRSADGELQREISDRSGELLVWSFYAGSLLIIILAAEGLDLLFSFFRTGKYRRKLRPLEELARQAEALSRVTLDQTRYFGTDNLDQLEQAIRRASDQEHYDGRDVRISTGEKELSGIEASLNHLLNRMQESYRQQARFVSDASHELRTPIAVIQGYADLLDRWGKEDPEILQEGITSIRREAENMHELVEQLLFLARGDSGRNVLQKTSVDLCELLGEVCEESQMIDSEHTYVFDAGRRVDGGDAPLILADPGMIKQSVRIFLQNAQKYSPKGSQIRIGVRSDELHGSYLIQDEGIGMAQQDLSHIFERFYRSDEARNSETGGTGLGLSIAKWIVDAHEGTIDVVSRQDFGTRFTVSFPKISANDCAK